MKECAINLPTYRKFDLHHEYGQNNNLIYKIQTYLGRQIVFSYNTNRNLKRGKRGDGRLLFDFLVIE